MCFYRLFRDLNVQLSYVLFCVQSVLRSLIRRPGVEEFRGFKHRYGYCGIVLIFFWNIYPRGDSTIFYFTLRHFTLLLNFEALHYYSLYLRELRAEFISEIVCRYMVFLTDLATLWPELSWFCWLKDVSGIGISLWRL